MASRDTGSDRPEISVEDANAGKWIMPPVSYINPVRRFCAFTGRPIARGYWQVMVGTEEAVFTDRGHALRYATYPMRFNKSEDDRQAQ
jgi:hypothetical protein